MQVAIIRKTSEYVDCDKTNIQEQIQDIVDDPTIFELDKTDNIDEFVLKTLMKDKPHQHVAATAVGICETEYSVYACHFIEKTVDVDLELINAFGSQLVSTTVVSDLIIAKYDLSYNTESHNESINISTKSNLSNIVEYNLVRDLVSIFKHRAVEVDVDVDIDIDVNGEFKEYFYIQNPLENIILEDPNYKDNYRYHEYEVFDYRLTVFVEVLDSLKPPKPLNKFASQLTNVKTYGRVFLSLSKQPEYNETPPYADLTNKRLELIHFLRSRSTEITKTIPRSDKSYLNFDKILELAKIRYLDMPIRPISILEDKSDFQTA